MARYRHFLWVVMAWVYIGISHLDKPMNFESAAALLAILCFTMSLDRWFSAYPA